ncbi:MAG TPA: hypothetical protein VI072_05585 [Polyangiaceae bacterium]
MQAAESLVEQVIKQCREGRFTGLLRVRAKEGDGELRFLSGIRDDARFGVSTGDEALERLMRATSPKFEAVPRLPGLSGGFKTRLPHEGALGEIRPVDLFRYCETYALTCTLELNSRGRQARAVYQIGELTSLETDAAGEDAVAAMLDATEGSYRFELPPLELPEGISVHLSQPPPGVEPTSTDFRAPVSSGRPAGVPASSDEPALARAEQELRRKAAEVAEAHKRSATPAGTPAAKLGDTDADLVRKLEEESRRKAQAEEEARKRREEEERRKAAQAAEEARRRAEAEQAQRKAEEARRRAEEEARRKAQAEAEEAKRKAAQAEEARRKAEAARRAEEEAEAKRKAEAEAARRAEEEAEARRKAEAEAAQRAEEEAEKRRKAEAEAARAKAEAEAAAQRKAEAERAAASSRSAPTEKRKPKGALARPEKAREEEQPEFERKGGSGGKILLLVLVLAAVAAWFFLNR